MKIGFIGSGNLAQALIGGLTDTGCFPASSIIVSNRSPQKLEDFRRKIPVCIAADNKEAAGSVDILFLTVKPNMYEAVLEEIKPVYDPHTILVSVAAGLSISYIEQRIPDSKVIRCMPNTPSMVGEGMNAICPNNQITDAELAQVEELFSLCGSCQVVTEDLFDVVTSVSGSGPAYVYMFIDAMAKAAEKDGMNRKQAIIFAAQTALGAAKMVLTTGTDPEVLTENVCSPGGTTIEAVNVFKEDGLYALVEKAQHACKEKSEKMHG